MGQVLGTIVGVDGKELGVTVLVSYEQRHVVFEVFVYLKSGQTILVILTNVYIRYLRVRRF